MKSPRGFGKKYFILRSIQAHCTQITIDKILTRTSQLHFLFYKSYFNGDDPPEDILEEECHFSFLSIKPCHCNCHFKRRTKIALFLSKRLKKCNCHNKYFSFRRSGIHPPITILS